MPGGRCWPPLNCASACRMTPSCTRRSQGHRSLGTRFAITGQHEQSRAALSFAIERYRAMEMTLWIPQVEAELAHPLRNAEITG
jgi:hypothetical protein